MRGSGGEGLEGEGCVPGAVLLSKEVAARRGDVAVVWTTDALRARSCVGSRLKRTCEDARNKHEKKERCLEEHVGRYVVWRVSEALLCVMCICRVFARYFRWGIEL